MAPPKYPAIDPSTVPTTDEIETTTNPTSSEMRAPASTRAKISLPSSSRPNQCAADGPSRRLASSCADGSNRDSDGPRSAATMATRTMAAPTLLIANPRIDQAVQKIGEQVHPDVRHGDEQDASLHERIVAKADRLNQQAADARPREDRLGDDRASEHGAELQSNQRNHGNEAVSKRVPDDCAQPRRSTRARCDDVLLAKLLEQRRASHSREDGGQRRAEGDGGKHEIRPGTASRHWQPSKLDRKNDGEQRPQP